MIRDRRQFPPGIYTHQCAIADEGREIGIFLVSDPRFDNAQSHWFFDDIVVIRHEALVDTTLEDLGGIIAADEPRFMVRDGLRHRKRTRIIDRDILGFAKGVYGGQHVGHGMPLLRRDLTNGICKRRRRLRAVIPHGGVGVCVIGRRMIPLRFAVGVLVTGGH